MQLVIGISGATRSGKSTLAAALAEHFGSKTVVLHQDSFASHALAARHESGWEATESIDHARLRAALAKHVTAKSAPKVIIVEGFRALHDPELVAAMTVLCWIDVSREVCRARKTPVSAEAFETYVWPRHEEYREFCFSSAGPFGEATASKHQTRLVLNGERTTVALVQQVLAAVTARKDVKSIAVQPSPRAAIKPTAAVQPSARAVARSRAAQGEAGERARRGQETLFILESGGYVEPASGEWVDASAAIAECVARSEFVPASAPLAAAAAVLKPRGRTRVEVADESTMAAARRLARRGLNVVALNFASFRNPGGGWLTGAEAQEESLARSSALVAALTAPGPCAAHYGLDGASSLDATDQPQRTARDRRERDPLYTHDMIYSPAVPVFRDEDGALLPQPWPLAFISAAAPNAGVARSKHAVSAKAVEAVYAQRAERVLALAHNRGHDAVVLGGWGCGVFKNDPRMVARVFGHLLHGRFGGCFRAVAFPILGLDEAKPNAYTPFEALASQGDGLPADVAAGADGAANAGDGYEGPAPSPPEPSRSLSEAYGAGASKYEETVLREWQQRGRHAGEAAKQKDWQTATAEFAACVSLRPDWEKGHACLARAQRNLELLERCKHRLAELQEAENPAEGAAEGVAVTKGAEDLEDDADPYSAAAYGTAPSFSVGRGVALADTAVDLARVEAALRALRPHAGRTLAVLTLSGALNPVHKGHLQMLEGAASALRGGGHSVLFSFLAPSSDAYLQHKLAGEALGLRERCTLCAAAVEARPTFGVLDWGVASSSAVALGTEALLRKAFPAFKWVCFQVVGADFARKAGLVDKKGRYVCLKRRGVPRDDAEWLKALEARKARNELPEGFVLAEAPPDEASSTRVRELYKAGRWDELAASKLLHPGVVRALRERRWLQRS